MKIKGLIDECFNDYKKPSMYIAFPTCTFKCDDLNDCKICQNSELVHSPDIEIKKEEIIERYINNPITSAIVFSGLEPFDSILDVVAFITCLREEYHCNDDIVIYTGYTEEELKDGRYSTNYQKTNNKTLADLYTYICHYPNIIIKFGRFVINEQPHFDEVLGIKLNSLNQYARKVSINNDSQK